MRGLWNAIWLGLKPATQFSVGALLFAADKERAGLFFSLLLVWTVGFSLCAVLIDRQLVVLAQQADTKPSAAVRALLPYLLAVATIVAAIVVPIAAWLARLPVGICAIVVGAGALAGISESSGWAILADKAYYHVLAALRFVSSGIFVGLAVRAFEKGGGLEFVLPIVGDSLVMFAGLWLFCAFEIFRAQPAKINFLRAAGFWLLSWLVYFYQQIDFWWTSAALSKTDLAAYRLGTTPRSFLLLGMSAILQPILFRISSKSWHLERVSAQKAATRATDLLVGANALFIIITCGVFLIYPAAIAKYREALEVAWALTVIYAGFGWLGNLSSTLMTNHGSIRLPVVVITGSIIFRAAIYMVFMLFGSFNLVALIFITETLAALGQVLFLRHVVAKKIWSLDEGLRNRILLRCPAAVLSLGFALATGFSKTSLLVLIGLQSAIAVHAILQNVRTDSLQPDAQLLKDAA